MNKVITLLLLSFMTTGALHAQKKIKTVESLSQAIEIKEFKSKYKNGVTIGTLELTDGSTLKKGDLLQIGAPSQQMKDFQFMWYGRYSVLNAMSPVLLSGDYSNTTVVIENIRGWRGMGMVIFSIDFKPQKGMFGGYSYGSTFGLERALSTGELINPNRPLNRAEAIAKLKEAKDLMELGMMSQEDFDALREQLTPIIMSEQ